MVCFSGLLIKSVQSLRVHGLICSAQMDSQAVRERPKIAALLEEVNVIKETMNIQVLHATFHLLSRVMQEKFLSSSDNGL